MSILKKVLAILAIISLTCEAHVTDREVMQKTVPVYAVALAADTIDTPSCRQNLHVFREAVDQRILWSLKVLDSSGKPGTGFIFGNNFWLGSRFQCLDTMNRRSMGLNKEVMKNNSLYRNPVEEYPPFDVRFLVANAIHNSTVQYHIRVGEEHKIKIGLCVPASCSPADIAGVLRDLFRNKTLLVRDLYSIDLSLYEVRDLQNNNDWLLDWRVILFIMVVLLILSLVIAGTVYDTIICIKRSRLQHQESDFENNNTTNVDAKCNGENVEPGLTEPSRLMQIVLCFSAFTNSKMLFDTKLGPKSLPCIHGIRFLSLFWIIMVHTIFFVIDFEDNRVWVWRIAQDFTAQLMNNATFAVDTFFLMSAFVLAYMYWGEHPVKSQRKKITWATAGQRMFIMIVKRYIRLTPVYLVVLGLYNMNMSWYKRTSIHEEASDPTHYCSVNWWSNLLYVNNFLPYTSMCMIWSWYLAVDMQFYVLTSFLLVLSSMYFYAAACIFGCLFLASIALPGYMSYSLSYDLTLDDQLAHLDYLYTPPWMRFSPYAMGIILAYLHMRYKNVVLSKKFQIIGWCIGSFCSLVVMLSTYDKSSISVESTAMYVALGKVAWSISIGWIIFACCTNHGGAVNKLLSFKGFIPFSRLTYCGYLLNPFLIHSLCLNSEAYLHGEALTVGVLSFGVLVASFLSGYVLSVMVEMPCTLLMRWYQKPRSK